jgi:ribosomal protein S18 acetylase RimI-like enzyme
MKIRKAVDSDIRVLVGLNRSVQDQHAAAFPERFQRDAPAELVERAFRASIQSPNSCWLVAEVDQPIAFLSAEFRDREANWCAVAQRVCYLAGIVVAPEFRRQGIARALVAELQREAAARGAAGIELDVWAFNDQAKRAFASLGFCTVMERMTLTATGQCQSDPGSRAAKFDVDSVSD